MVGDVASRVLQGTLRIAFRIGATAGPGAVDQLRVDRLGREAALQACTDPGPVVAGGGGVALSVITR